MKRNRKMPNCPKCQKPLEPFTKIYKGIESGYKYSCENCEEDFYKFEVTKA